MFLFSLIFTPLAILNRGEQVSLDVIISVMMVLVVLRYQGVPEALSQKPERSNSVRYIIKVSAWVCEVADCLLFGRYHAIATKAHDVHNSPLYSPVSRRTI